MENLKYTVIDHPLVQHKLSLMRDVNTGSKEFRELVSETSMLMCYEAMRDLPLKEVDIQTPLGIAKSKIISGRKVAFVPILRSGLGMVDGVMSLIPAAKSVTSAHSEILRPQTLLNTTASFPRTSLQEMLSLPT